jgi:hypothetical protein
MRKVQEEDRKSLRFIDRASEAMAGIFSRALLGLDQHRILASEM